MTKLSDYTTEELTRLTTLKWCSLKGGEFGLWKCGGAVAPRLRTMCGFVDDRGVVMFTTDNAMDRGDCDLLRRVKSFCDSTELDPPQAEMVAELERRRRPVVSNATHNGRRVRYTGMIAVVVHPDVVKAFERAWPYACGTPRELHVVNLKSGNAYVWNAADVELLD